MANPIVRFSYDKTGINPDNLVVGEVHTTSTNAIRAIAPTYGAFYSESLQVYDHLTDQLLQKGTQYRAVELLQDITMRTGKEVNLLVLILDSSVSKQVRISYQAVGDKYQNDASGIVSMYETIAKDNRSVDWINVLNKQLEYPPTLHYHLLEDVYGFEPLVDALERVRNAIIISNVPAFEGLADWVKGQLNNVDGAMNTLADILNALDRMLRDEINNRTVSDVVIKQEIDSTINNRLAILENSLNSNVATINSTLQSLDTRLISEVNSRTQNDTTETNRATAAETNLGTLLNNEITRAQNSEAYILNSLIVERDRLTNSVNDIVANLQAEINRASTAENSLSGFITAETNRAIAAETGLTTNLTSEISNRQAADANLQTQINNLNSRFLPLTGGALSGVLTTDIPSNNSASSYYQKGGIHGGLSYYDSVNGAGIFNYKLQMNQNAFRFYSNSSNSDAGLYRNPIGNDTLLAYINATTGDLVASGNVAAYSDPRLKNIESIIKDALQICLGLEGVYFTWNNASSLTATKHGKRDIGLLANQVKAILPEIISQSEPDDNGNVYDLVSYEKLVPVLLEAIKTLHERVSQLENNGVNDGS